MKPKVHGLHHFTAIAGDPTENAKFYVNTLGLRMVKKTVNHDAPEMYHLFYGDREGNPGTSVTFFPGMAQQQGESGAGMITELGLKIPGKSLHYWKDRLEEKEVQYEEVEWNRKETIRFEDPDGLPLRLVPEDTGEYSPWPESTVIEENQIRGMNHVTIQAHSTDNLEKVLDIMNLEKQEESTNTYYRAEDGSGVEIIETSQHGRMGRGSVHHTAFKAADNKGELEKWRDQLQRIGLQPSPVISRKYFSSIYCRMPTGVLFEFSTMGPGYTADESVEELGTNFVLPEELQERKEEIIKNLPEFSEEEINQ